MVTRVRIEAEGRTPDEVTHILETAHEKLIGDDHPKVLDTLFGEAHGDSNGGRPGLADAQAGEFVIERFARSGPPGIDGQLFYRGRMVAHYATPSKTLDLRSKQTP